jgi:hypothetical protein
VLQYLNTCAKRSLKPTSGTVILLALQHKVEREILQRTNTAGRCRAVFNYVFENWYEKEFYNPKTKSNDSLLNSKYYLNYSGRKLLKS